MKTDDLLKLAPRRPWLLSETRIDKHGKYREMGAQGGKVWLADLRDNTTFERAAGDLTFRAVNSFEAMRKLLQDFPGFTPDNAQYGNPWEARKDAALKLADGEA